MLDTEDYTPEQEGFQEYGETQTGTDGSSCQPCLSHEPCASLRAPGPRTSACCALSPMP